MSSDTSVSTTLWPGAPAGNARSPKVALPGCISARISVPRAANCCCNRPARICATWPLCQLTRVAQIPDLIAPISTVPSGETRDIHRAGGCYVTLVGSNPLFHLPQDRWPQAVDADVVARIATAAAALVVAVTR